MSSPRKRGPIRRAIDVPGGVNILVAPPRCHNERLGLWVPAFAGTTHADSIFKPPDFKHDSAISRRGAPEFWMNLAPGKTEGVGNAGCATHPQPRVRNKTKHTSVVTTVAPGSPGIPARNGFTAYIVLSPATNSSCHRHPRIWLVQAPSGPPPPPKLTPPTGARHHRPCPPRNTT